MEEQKEKKKRKKKKRKEEDGARSGLGRRVLRRRRSRQSEQVVGWTIKIKALLIDAILNRVHNIVTLELGYAFVSLIPHHSNEVRERLYI